eukprot:1868605-Rhodomonas_salina.2
MRCQSVPKIDWAQCAISQYQGHSIVGTREVVASVPEKEWRQYHGGTGSSVSSTRAAVSSVPGQ